MINLEKNCIEALHFAMKPYPFNAIMASAVKFFFKNRYESVVIFDKDYMIQFADTWSERFFGLPPGGCIGKSIMELAPNQDYNLAITNGDHIIGRIIDVDGEKRVSSVYPLKEKGEIIGAIVRVVFYPLEEIVRTHKQIARLKNEMHDLRQRERNEYSSAYTFDNILYTSMLMRETVATAKRIAAIDADVLIEGESGTGKELFAHSIHSFRSRSNPFVRINCAAIPFELAESQLFGYEKGAYTGSNPSGKTGVFEIAKNGILFLDEISSLPISIQAKLLRVLQEREVQKLGSSKTIKVNFRFIAATNVNLLKLVEKGNFRHDFYYRVARVTLKIPSLRERTEDIPLYLSTFLKTINKTFKVNIQSFSKEAMDVLVKYPWPGNVRELIHVLEQIAINAWDTDEVNIEQLPKELFFSEEDDESRPPQAFSTTSNQDFNCKEKELLIYALKKTGGNKRQAAKLSGISRVTFYKKIKQYGISNIN